MFQAVGSGSKRRARVPSSGVGLEMGGLAFEAVGSGSKRRARVRGGGLRFEVVGSHSKQWGPV